MDVLPLCVCQVHLLIWTHTKHVHRYLQSPMWPKEKKTLQKYKWEYFHIVLYVFPESSSLPWLTAKRSFCMIARLPLTLYSPSMHRPAGDHGRKTLISSVISADYSYGLFLCVKQKRRIITVHTRPIWHDLCHLKAVTPPFFYCSYINYHSLLKLVPWHIWTHHYSPRGQCTSWQRSVQCRPPGDTNWTDCSRTPDLKTRGDKNHSHKSVQSPCFVAAWVSSTPPCALLLYIRDKRTVFFLWAL